MQKWAAGFKYFLLLNILFLSFYGGTCHNGDLGSLATPDFTADPSDITLVAGGAGMPIKFTLQVDEKQRVQIDLDTSIAGNPAGLKLHHGLCVGASCLIYRNDYIIDTLFAPITTLPGTYTCRINLFYIEKTPLDNIVHTIDDVSLTVHVLGHATSPIVFSDSFFLMKDWNDSLLFSPWPIRTFNDHVDIHGNPGAYGETFIEFDSGSAQTQVVPELFQRAVYDPSASGNITFIDFAWDRYDSIFNNKNIQTVTGIAPLIIQNRIAYIENWHYGAAGIQWFHEESKTLPASRFTEFPVASGKHPDFSLTGSPLQFGYAIKVPVQSIAQPNALYMGIDNFSVTVRRQ